MNPSAITVQVLAKKLKISRLEVVRIARSLGIMLWTPHSGPCPVSDKQAAQILTAHAMGKRFPKKKGYQSSSTKTPIATSTRKSSEYPANTSSKGPTASKS